MRDMTYLGKGSDDEETETNDSNLKRNDLVKAIVKQDDILKQSIKTVGYEDTSQYFVQSGPIERNASSKYFLSVESGRLDFIVGGILHIINVKSLYATLPASRWGRDCT